MSKKKLRLQKDPNTEINGFLLMENQTYEIVDYVHDEVMTFAYAFSVLGSKRIQRIWNGFNWTDV